MERIASGDELVLADTVSAMVWAARPDGAVEYLNRRWTEYSGLAPEALVGEGWTALIHPDDFGPSRAIRARVLQSGEPYDVEYRLRGRDGGYRWFRVAARPVRAADGTIVRWWGTATDIDDRVDAQRTLQFLLDAGELLAASLDVERTIDALARLAVPHLADSAAVYMPERDGRLNARVVADVDPSAEAQAWAVVRRYPASRANDGIVRVMKTGESIVAPRITPEMLAGVAHDEEHLAALLRIGIASAITVPLRAGGEPIGVLQLINHAPDRTVTDADRRAAEALAARASIALDNARLFARERQIAGAFQDAALPASLPRVPGVVLDAVYEPGSSESLVGGDWYDALALRDGRLVVSVGDVAGSGLRAAVTMSAMRQAVRTVAQLHAEPATILDAADRTLRTEHPDAVVTAFVGVYDPLTGELHGALAGHPAPLIRRRDGSVEAFPAGAGVPLGLRSRSEPATETTFLAVGDLLVLYTDGVTEVDRDVVAGEVRLRAAVADLAPDDQAPARTLQSRVLPSRASDDVALFAMRAVPFGALRRWRFASDDAEAARHARREFVAGLQSGGWSAEATATAELVLGELVGNVARHAPGEVEVISTHGDESVLHVLDRGAGFVLAPRLPSDLLAERGRGLYLVWRLTEEFTVSLRPGGGSHARAVLTR